MNLAKTYSPREAFVLAGARAYEEAATAAVSTTPAPDVLVDKMTGWMTAAIQKKYMQQVSVTAVGSSHSHAWYHAIVKAGEVGRAYQSTVDALQRLRNLNCRYLNIGTSETGEDAAETAAVYWYSNFMYFVRANQLRQAFDVLFHYVEDAYDVADTQKLNQMLAQVRPSDMSAEVLISVLRAAGRARESLTRWHELVEAAREKVESEGLPKRVLRGL